MDLVLEGDPAGHITRFVYKTPTDRSQSRRRHSIGLDVPLFGSMRDSCSPNWKATASLLRVLDKCRHGQ